eukprot:TRINITY_DN29786_c0_g1_i1.p1 TRINITY_DN29786_c0_g1~~TRINITY_DN29786_c0_g1_i1.p1  ORF type:complete len:304 (+),score=34.64 TRINITY_DN29786_c0_g1_i1:92-913(+)
MATWGGAPLYKDGFWAPKQSPFATPPPHAPYYWAPEGWKSLKREGEAMRERYDRHWGRATGRARATSPRRGTEGPLLAASSSRRLDGARSEASSSSAASASLQPRFAAAGADEDWSDGCSVSSDGRARQRRHARRRRHGHYSVGAMARERRPMRAYDFQLAAPPTPSCRTPVLAYSRSVPPGWFSYPPQLPAGTTTYEQDRPESARRLYALGGGRSRAFRDRYSPSYRFPFEGSFGRNGEFTNDAFFHTGRQSHGTDLRRITSSSPTQITRVC